LNELRLGFAGTPDFAAIILAGLIGAGRRPVVVYTQPDRQAGRGRRSRPSPVKALAQRAGLPVEQPSGLKDPEVARRLAHHALDVLVVAAYGLILPPAILRAPRFGCINVHASLLPRWRGAAPIERALMAGDVETGVSIMLMDAGLDTGPVFLARRCPIPPDADGPSLERTLAGLGTQTLLECLDGLPGLEPRPQPRAGATYAPKLRAEDAVIDWARSGREIERQVRALTGRMPAYSCIGDVRVRILTAAASDLAHSAQPGSILCARRERLEIACGTGCLAVSRLQVSRGKGVPLRAGEAISGFPDLFHPGRMLHGGTC
jgi:methionyl-tRNA formyltransferase